MYLEAIEFPRRHIPFYLFHFRHNNHLGRAIHRSRDPANREIPLVVLIEISVGVATDLRFIRNLELQDIFILLRGTICREAALPLTLEILCYSSTGKKSGETKKY